MFKTDSLKPAVLCLSFLFVFLSLFFLTTFCALASEVPEGERLYKVISDAVRGKGDTTLPAKMKEQTAKLDWSQSQTLTFEGNLRLLKPQKGDDVREDIQVYLIRKLSGEIFVLVLPEAGADPQYAGLEKMLQDKMAFKIEMLTENIDGRDISFARLVDRPYQLTFDKIFKISIILLLFLVMVGMGLTLSVKDFVAVFTKPLGIITGLLIQYGILPLVAVLIGRLMGFYETMPFIFVGMVLAMSSPGGVTSNLLTQLTKGDLALSISLTSVSTVMALVFTPLLLSLYCSNVPNVVIPVGLIVQTIVVLVIIPLVIGMSVRAKWPNAAQKSTKVFSILGLVALLFLIVAGIISNMAVFKEFGRYSGGALAVLILAVCALILGMLGAKLIRANNSQNRAISFQALIRNASLSMAISLLIQDIMGDFYSAMFVTTAFYGIAMYLVGTLAIAVFRKMQVEQ